MKIYALFGITCVGKSTIGKLLSDRMGYDYYDMDDEIQEYYNDTLDNIYKDCCFPMSRDEKQAKVFSHILHKCKRDTIIAVSPMYYYKLFRNLLKNYSVICIELKDTPENIAKRVIFTDENDEIIVDDIGEYKENLRDVKYFIFRYKNTFAHLEWKFYIGGRSALDCADELEIILKASPEFWQDMFKRNKDEYMPVENPYEKYINYIIRRVQSEKSVPAYLASELEGKLGLKGFIEEILDNQMAWFESGSEADELTYILQKTSYKEEMIEIVLWFAECYQMKNNEISVYVDCLKCGYEKVFLKEGKELFMTYFVCEKCKTKMVEVYKDEQ